MIKQEEFEEQRAKKQILKAHFEVGLSSDPYVISSSTITRPSSDVGGSRSTSLLQYAKDIPQDAEDDNMDDGQLAVYLATEGDKMDKIERTSHPGKITDENKWPSLTGGTKDVHPGKEKHKTLDADSLMDLQDLSLHNAKSTRAGTTDPPSAVSETSSTNFQLDNDNNKSEVTDATIRSKMLICGGVGRRDGRRDVDATTTDKWDNGSGGGRLASNLSTSSNVSTQYTDLTRYDTNRFFDPFESKYACPAEHCLQKFDSAKDFDKHLRSGAHIGGSARYVRGKKQEQKGKI